MNRYRIARCLRMKLLDCEKYQLSIDGLEQTYDWFRKPGFYQTTLEKIDIINRAGIRSVVDSRANGDFYAPDPQCWKATVLKGLAVRGSKAQNDAEGTEADVSNWLKQIGLTQ